MQLQVKAQHASVSDSVRAYAEKRLSKLSRRLYEQTAGRGDVLARAQPVDPRRPRRRGASCSRRARTWSRASRRRRTRPRWTSSSTSSSARSSATATSACVEPRRDRRSATARDEPLGRGSGGLGRMPLDPGRDWLAAGITGLQRQREWDAVATADAAGTPGDGGRVRRARATARFVVESGGAADPAPFAAALGDGNRPARTARSPSAGRGLGGRRRLDRGRPSRPRPTRRRARARPWDGSTLALTVDSLPADPSRAPALERIAAARETGPYAAHAHRLRGDLSSSPSCRSRGAGEASRYPRPMSGDTLRRLRARSCAWARAAASSASRSRPRTSGRSSPSSRRCRTTSFAARRAEFKQRLENGETLEDLIFEAYAAVREAFKRTIGVRLFDVQLMGGIALHEGDIAEMKTG